MNKPLSIAVAITAALAISGCSSTNVEELEKENQQLRHTVAQLESQSNTSTKPQSQDEALLPPNPKPGECYARVWEPTEYETTTKRMLVSPATQTSTVVPAKYEKQNKRIEIAAASYRVEKVPAVYKTENKRMLVQEAKRVWRTHLGDNAPIASEQLLAAAKKGKVDLDGASVGMCFHDHYLPDDKSSYTQKKVLVEDASTDYAINEAKYRWVEKKIKVKEASTRYEEVPAVYETVTEKVLIKPAHSVWKKGTGPIQRIDESTGEIMCLVEVPAQYLTVEKQVEKKAAYRKKVNVPAEYKTVRVKELVSEASAKSHKQPAKYKEVRVVNKAINSGKYVWHEVHNTTLSKESRAGSKICLTETPAQYETVAQRVLVTPATTKKVKVPAQYQTVEVQHLVSDAKEVTKKTPAQYKTVEQQKVKKKGQMAWRSILCETNMTTAKISEIQQALKQEGYYKGDINGKVDNKTMFGVNQFQRAKGLPVDKYLNIETVKALGVTPK